MGKTQKVRLSNQFNASTGLFLKADWKTDSIVKLVLSWCMLHGEVTAQRMKGWVSVVWQLLFGVKGLWESSSYSSLGLAIHSQVLQDARHTYWFPMLLSTDSLL